MKMVRNGRIIFSGGLAEGDAPSTSIFLHTDCTTAADFQFYPQRCAFGRRESYFALQVVEGRAAETENVRVVAALRWHSSGREVRLGLPLQYRGSRLPVRLQASES